MTIKTVLFEGVRSRLVLATVGAFCTCPWLDANVRASKATFVETTSWKSWARSKGAVGAIMDIKGVKALRETGFDVAAYGLESDDICDSILIYQTWRARQCCPTS